jgi:excisionase family DNA binding protein
MSQRQFISTTKAAARLDVSPNTIRNFIVEGRLKGHRVGRLINLDAAEVDAFAAAILTGT